VEVRHRSFLTPAFVELLRKHALGLVNSDTAGKFPYFEDTTADFVYVRLHGDTKLYESRYSPEALERWARRVLALASGRPVESPVLVSPDLPEGCARDVYVYFDNDIKVHAPFDARALAEAVVEGADGPASVRARASRLKAPRRRDRAPHSRRP
jgi:uncharacterized protein YecE (DUF72 family)